MNPLSDNSGLSYGHCCTTSEKFVVRKLYKKHGIRIDVEVCSVGLSLLLWCLASTVRSLVSLFLCITGLDQLTGVALIQPRTESFCFCAHRGNNLHEVES
jgi:hypothetical protein